MAKYAKFDIVLTFNIFTSHLTIFNRKRAKVAFDQNFFLVAKMFLNTFSEIIEDQNQEV